MVTASSGTLIARNRAVAATHRGIEDLAGRLARFGSYALFVLLPIAVLPAASDAFILPKVTVLRWLTIFILLAYAVRAVVRGSVRWRWLPLDTPALAFAAVAILATVFSVSPSLSLGGDFHRYDGLYTVLNYVALYFVGSRTFVTSGTIRRAIECFAATAAIVAGVGLAERFERGVVPAGSFDGRLSSTFGNPDFLGSYLVMAIPVVAALALGAGDRRARLTWMGVVVVTTVALTMTLTRGAWVGFAAALVVFVFEGRRLVGRIAWPVLMAVAVALGLALVGSAPATYPAGAIVPPTSSTSGSHQTAGAATERSVIGRLAAASDIQAGTAGYRLQLWQNALPLVAERPFLGSGLSTLTLVFPRVATPEYASGAGQGQTVDQVHNGYLQLLVTTGALGLAVYLWLLVTCALALRRGLPRAGERSRWIGVGVLAGWTGYLVQDFFLFGVVGTAGVWWLLCGVAMAVATRDSIRHASISLPRRMHDWRWALVGGLSITAAALFALTWKPVVADFYLLNAHHLAEVRGYAIPSQTELWPRLHREAIAWSGAEFGYVMEYTTDIAVAADAYPDSPQRRPLLRDAIAKLDTAIAAQPLHSWLYFDRGVLYARLGDEYLPTAFADLQRATQLYPNFYRANIALAQVGHFIGRIDESITAERRVLVGQPGNREVMADLATDLTKRGRTAEALTVIEQALRFGDDANLRVLQGRAYEGAGQPDAAGVAYRAALTVDPAHGEARLRLGQLATKGDVGDKGNGNTGN